MLNGVPFLKRAADYVASLLFPRQYIHVVGNNLDKADIRLNGKKIDLESLPGRAKSGGLSEYFKLEAGRTTYVFWNNPDALQRQIQSEPTRRNHIVFGDGTASRLNLVTDFFGRHLKPAFNFAGRRVEEPESQLSTQWGEEVQAQAVKLREIVRERRSTIPGALSPA